MRELSDKLHSASQNQNNSQKNTDENKNEGKPAEVSSNSIMLGKKDNILEFCLEKAIFDSSAYDREKTFISWMMPFAVDDPLQHTNLAIGSIANYRHTSLYKLTMNSQTLKTLQEHIPGK